MNDNYSYVICGIYMADVPMTTTLQIYHADHLVSMLIPYMGLRQQINAILYLPTFSKI